MYQETIKSPAIDGYNTMAFTDRVLKLCAAGDQAAAISRPATLDEALSALATARFMLGNLVSDEIAAAAIGHNPEIFQFVQGSSSRRDQPAFLAFLPLNAKGAHALVNGRFSGARPDLTMICTQAETPCAIYIWLIFAPGALTPILRGLAPLLGKLAPAGCPLFTRAVTGHAQQLFPTMGFVKARHVYPAAADDLLALPPRSGFPHFREDLARPDPAKITVRVARSMEDMLKCFSVRAATYMSEQECPFDEEFDGNDFCATHFLGEINGEPAGCIRVRYFADFVKLERLAVRQEFRSSRLSFRLVKAAIGFCQRKGYARAYGHSRSDLTRFWGMFGFKAIRGRPSFMFSDVEYIELEAPLAAAEDKLAIGTAPHVLIRPEGEWDEPGPLDRSAERCTAHRRLRINSRIRGVRTKSVTSGVQNPADAR